MGNAPESSYGVLRKAAARSANDRLLEQMRRQGFAVYDPGLGKDEIDAIAARFDALHEDYLARYGAAFLQRVDEQYTIRAPLLWPTGDFDRLALHPGLLDVVGALIEGQFILNQQNGIINPPGKRYNQGAWHRDFPYQHFVSDTPLGVNALYCVDEFSNENGGTWVIPASHRFGEFPSEGYIAEHARQVEAPAGSFVLLDCMVYHSGGANVGDRPRRAVNHVFNIPFFKQQINLTKSLSAARFSDREQAVLGFRYAEPDGVESFLASRQGRSD